MSHTPVIHATRVNGPGFMEASAFLRQQRVNYGVFYFITGSMR